MTAYEEWRADLEVRCSEHLKKDYEGACKVDDAACDVPHYRRRHPRLVKASDLKPRQNLGFATLVKTEIVGRARNGISILRLSWDTEFGGLICEDVEAGFQNRLRHVLLNLFGFPETILLEKCPAIAFLKLAEGKRTVAPLRRDELARINWWVYTKECKGSRWILERTRDISKSPENPELEFSWRDTYGGYLVRESVPGVLYLPEGARLHAICRMLFGHEPESPLEVTELIGLRTNNPWV